MQERRRSHRFAVSLPLRVSCEGEPQGFDTFTEDVSEGGLTFMLLGPLLPGTTVTCIMNLSITKPAGRIAFQGRIIRVEIVGGRPQPKVTMVVDAYEFLAQEASQVPGSISLQVS